VITVQGFRKVDPDRWEFANDGFLRGQRHLLRNIRRKKAASHQSQASEQGPDPCVLEVGKFGLDAEIDRLRRDKQIIMVELVKLRQQQQNTRAYLKDMEEKLSGTETKQRQMMSFLAKAIQNPCFVEQLIQRDRRKELEEAISKKRRRSIDQGPSNAIGGGICSSLVKMEPQDYSDISSFSDLELEQLAGDLDIQGLSEKFEEEDEGNKLGGEGSEDKALDTKFWEELWNEEDIGLLGGEGEDEEEDADVLAEQLGFLGSSPK